jgi:hypothetical protein
VNGTCSGSCPVVSVSCRIGKLLGPVVMELVYSIFHVTRFF